MTASTDPKQFALYAAEGARVRAAAYTDTVVAAPTVSLIAATNLTGNFAVKANSSGLADVPSLSSLPDGLAILGITTGAAASGAAVSVQIGGVMDNSAWSWTPGLPVYAGDLGVLSQTPPSGKWVLSVGVAETATKLVISIGSVISTP